MTRTVDELEAENARLRAYIATAKECAEAGALVALQEENDRYRAAFAEAIGLLREGKSIHSAFCQWCGEVWPIVEAETFEQARDHAAAHANRCAKNPIRIEREALREAVIHLGSLQLNRRRDVLEAWAIRETANDLSAPFSDERVQQRLADALDEEPKP